MNMARSLKVKHWSPRPQPKGTKRPTLQRIPIKSLNASHRLITQGTVGNEEP